MDAFAAAIWCAVTLTVVHSVWTVSCCVFPDDTAFQRTMHTVTMIWTWIVLVSCGLGAFGLLSVTNLGLGVLAVSCGTWRYFRRRCADGCRAVASPDSRGRWQVRFWHVVWSINAALATVLLADRGVLQFPQNWDTLMYHRPLIDHWLQTSSLYVPECAVWFVPGNNELMGLWWGAPFTGDFWVGLMSVPGALLLALGTYELGRVIGLMPLLRHSAVIAVLGSSVMFHQITSAKNDVAVAGLFVTGLAYGLRHVEGRRRSDLVFGGAALGLLAGVKYYALGYAGVGWAGVSAMAWSQWGRRRALSVSLALGGIMLLPAGYWYGRNAVVSGTPLYPMGHLRPHAEHAQMRRSAWRSSFLGNGRLAVWPQYAEAVWKRGGVCQIAALLAVPTSLAWLLGSVLTFSRSHLRPNTAALRWGLVIVLMGTWINFAITPFTVSAESDQLIESVDLVARFSQVPLALSVVAFSLLLSDVSRWIKARGGERLIGSVLSALLPLSFATMTFATFSAKANAVLDHQWLIILLIALDLVLLSALLRELSEANGGFAGRVRRFAFPVIVGSGMAAFVLASSCLSEWWHSDFATHYDRRLGTQAFSILEETDGAVPSVTALYFRYYPFFGSRRQFRAHRPRQVISRESLLRYLLANKSDTIAVAHSGSSAFEFESYDKAKEWINELPDAFDRIAHGSEFDLYRVDQERLADRFDALNSIVSDGRKSVGAHRTGR